MGSNTIKTRIQLKNDTERNWNLATGFIPRKGEVIIYSSERQGIDILPNDRNEPFPFSRLKIGDGVTSVVNLPFLHAGVMQINNQNPNGEGNFTITAETIGLNSPLNLVGELSTATGAIGIVTDDYTSNIPTIADLNTYIPRVGDIVLDRVKGIEYICVETATDSEQEPPIEVYKWKQLGEKAAAVYQQNITNGDNYNHNYPITISPQMEAQDTTDKILKYNYLKFNPFTHNLIIGNSDGKINGYSIHSAISKDFADYNPDTYPAGLNYKGEARDISDSFSTYTLVNTEQGSNGVLAEHGDLVYLNPEEGDDRVEGYYVFTVDEILNTNTWEFLTPKSIGQSDKLITERLLYYYEGNSNISKLGTITQGVWNGTTISVADGGTNNTSVITNGLLYGSSNNSQPQIKSAVPAWDSWVNGTSSGPEAQIQLGNIVYKNSPIPIANTEHSGVVNTGNQNFIGTKTFVGTQIKLQNNSTTTNISRFLFTSTELYDINNNYKLTDLGEWASIGVKLPAIKNDITYNTQISFRQFQITSTEDLETQGNPTIFSPGTNYEEYFLPEVSDELTENKNYDIRTSKSSAYNVDTATHLSSAPNNTTTFYRGDKTWSNILTNTMLAIGGTATNIASAAVSGITSYLQIVAGSGSNTGYTGIGFHNPNISSASFGYQQLDANTGLFRYRSDDTYWYITTGTVGLATPWRAGDLIVGTDGADKIVIGYLASSTNGAVIGAHNSALSNWAPLYVAGTQVYIRGSETTWAKWVDGCLSLFPTTSNYREGIRIHSAGSWSDITLCGNDNTGDSGITANSWFIGNNNGNFYISRNGSSSSSSAILSCVNNIWSWNGTANGSISGNASTATWLQSHICDANGGTAGYFHFVTLVINRAYVNKVIKLNYVGRGRTGGIILIWVNNSGNADPDLNVNYAGGPPIYFKKSTTSTWNLYVQKEENYGNDLFTIVNPGALADGGITLTWQNAHVASLPSGYSTAAVYTPVLNISGTATHANHLAENTSTTTSDPGGLTWLNGDMAAAAGLNANDGPTKAWWYILRNRHTNTSNNYYTDVAIPFNSNSIYYKIVRNNSVVNSAWCCVLDSWNYTSYTVTKTGSGASGTWGISVTGSSASCTGNAATASSCSGNAATATNADKVDNYHATAFPLVFSAGTSSTNAVIVTHASTGSDSGRGQCFAYGNANGAPWFTSIQYGYTYVKAISLSSRHQASVHFISATQFAIITQSWDNVNVIANHGTVSSVATASANQAVASGDTNHYAWINGDSVTGAVWNDYAENRETINAIPGQCVYEIGDDTLKPTEERLSHFAGIVSDTWGFSQGETETAKTPIAVAGRVLAYTYRNREEYKPGDVLCAAPGGTVDIMTREEIQMYPDRIVGTVSCVPDYETWGGGEMADRGPVEVNGRIWVKVK